MYDVSKLKTVEECRIVMERTKKLGLDELYEGVFKRMCEIVGGEQNDPNDPIIKDFFEMLGALEQLLSEKNGKKTAATRTRLKLKNKGVIQSLIEWTRAKTETPGFKLLVEKGLAQYTGEFIVVKYSSRFPSDVVILAKERLQQNNVGLPTEVK
jgi:hypothetical protein